jgi:uncharacterized membrane protein YeaQ/YmgE (transglycosylase-associated protein family)
MNKALMTTCITIGGIAGSYAPVIFGDTNMFDAWGILAGTIGSFVGIWLAVVINKRLG